MFSRADNLEVLSIGRNQIKKLEGLDDVAGTLRELWISYNLIDKLNGLEKVPPYEFVLPHWACARAQNWCM
jgi:hypothetical protein